MRTALLALTAGLMVAPAQRALQFEVTYSCSNGQTRLKVLACAGTADADACDIQYLDSGSPQGLGARISAPRKQVTDMLQTCVIERPRPKPENPPAQTPPSQPRPAAQRLPQATPPAAPPTQPRPAAPPPVQQVGAGGFKVGDTVQVNSLFGWMDGKVLRIRGNSYFVHTQTGADVWKDYPTEVRRLGPATAEDKAHGQYELHDRVQVLFEGKWVESEIIGSLNNEFQVKLPGNRTAWATVQNLRYIGPQVKAAPKTGPPKPGLVSCAGKIEGRYSGGGFGNFTITFRNGKANVAMYGDGEDVECWTGSGKIYLRIPDPNIGDMVLDINNDGTLDSPAGELKKKGN